jgi:glucose-1-phosphate thymidylyltransferase
VEFDNNDKVISIEEKPKKPKSNFAVTGFYVFDNQVIKIAKKLKPSKRGEIEVTDINRCYMKMGELKVEKIKGAWLDAGTYDSLLEASVVVKNKKIYEHFDPMIDQAIAEFNFELKKIAKKRLN